MLNIYTEENSEYLNLTGTWHKELSPWKADKVHQILTKNNISSSRVVEVGCGAGEILHSLNQMYNDNNVIFDGFDIAVDAIKIAKEKQAPNVKFYLEDFLEKETNLYDVLLMIDVFEHVPDYMGFVSSCRERAKYKVFHIPLDIHLSSLIRNKMIDARKEVGHLHYFTKDTALATLNDCGYSIIDYTYTKGSQTSKKLKSRIANIPRRLLYPIAKDLTVKLFGGYSLLVLAK